MKIEDLFGASDDTQPPRRNELSFQLSQEQIRAIVTNEVLIEFLSHIVDNVRNEPDLRQTPSLFGFGMHLDCDETHPFIIGTSYHPEGYFDPELADYVREAGMYLAYEERFLIMSLGTIAPVHYRSVIVPRGQKPPNLDLEKQALIRDEEIGQAARGLMITGMSADKRYFGGMISLDDNREIVEDDIVLQNFTEPGYSKYAESIANSFPGDFLNMLMASYAHCLKQTLSAMARDERPDDNSQELYDLLKQRIGDHLGLDHLLDARVQWIGHPPLS